ncbi:cytochrome C assembly protein [Virgibacillus profundi]|uniref:Cytochrome C assembly protein n=1 Tax=Virgibacillus profundi TaxID=2024555 RepID=A0A2A2I984_9BACI|nr:cytochrome c biogenesis protein CcsA [Virgibacillus profundi]PAV27700.1 cytochrome C assembly protein [Virgibacillus profundi]PXY51855.1 cytochrome C assembly protein [Virgibacillus profundi]
MFEMKWLYEITLIIYGLSLVGYFIDFIQRNRRANNMAFWLLSMVWIIQTVFLLYQVLIEKSFPVQTLNDSLFFYAWILITFSLVINRLFPVHFIVFFTNFFGFFIYLLYISTNAQENMNSSGIEFVHEILIAHITLAIVSYGFFTISFLLSLLYILQYRFLKDKKGFKWMWRIGDLRGLDNYSFIAVTIGVPLLLIGIILGVVWAYVANAEFYWFDMKTLGSLLVLVVYIVYLFLRLVRGYQGKTISMYNTAAFLILLINFFLFSSLSNFHF